MQNLVDPSKGEPNVTKNLNTYEIRYPCKSSSDCTDYEVKLPRGLYKFEAYGASGGISSLEKSSSYIDPITKQCNQSIVDFFHGNAKCQPSKYSSGPGGYVSSILYLTQETTAFIMIGGQGTYDWKELPSDAFSKEAYIPGGYGGGAPARNHPSPGSYAASGGGRTALMMLEDNIFHSVLVSGGGGGCDDYGTADNDGNGGAGGGLSAQSFWIYGEYHPEFEANSSHFFTYGNGEAIINGKSAHPQGSQSIANNYEEFSGAGGGWFGGFASFHHDGGSGGGSSFALTKDALIPTSMTVYDNFYENPVTGNYAFSSSSKFIMSDVVHSPGIWIGNGMFRITYLAETIYFKCAVSCKYYSYSIIQILMSTGFIIDILVST